MSSQVSIDYFCHFLLICYNERRGFGSAAPKPRRRMEDRHVALKARSAIKPTWRGDVVADIPSLEPASAAFLDVSQDGPSSGMETMQSGCRKASMSSMASLK